MKRRGLLGTMGIAAASGCLTSVETPQFGGDSDRPPLNREDFVSEQENASRETIIPNVSMLSVSTTGRASDYDGARVVTPPTEDDSRTTTQTTDPSTEAGPQAGPPETTVEAPERDFEAEGLYVTDDFWRYRTHIHRYNAEEVTTTVYPIEPSNETSVKVVVAAYVYPRGGLVDSAVSNPFHPTGDAQQVTVSLNLSAAPEGVPLQYVAAVVPNGIAPESIGADDLYAIMETDPFERTADGIRRSTQPEQLSEASGAEFERRRVEGGYVQTLEGRTNGQEWEVSFLAFESAYTAAARRSRGRKRAEYVSFELLEGAANEIAQFLYDAAENNGFTSEFERIQFALSFVQRLPYVEDNVSKGYDDYTKFIMETLTELSGDCEDTSILFASILESEPFNYDAVLLEPPGHMGVGLLIQPAYDGFAYIYEDRKYYYVETTVEGWGIGQIPDQYREQSADVYDV